MMVVRSLIYEDVALADPFRQWEMHDGKLLEKSPMSDAHNVVLHRLDHQFVRQLDFNVYDIRINSARVRLDAGNYYIPDLAIIPIPSLKPLITRRQSLEVFRDPLILVAEIWSPSTGNFDIDEKIPHYMARGDREIWRIHPYDLTLTSWQRQESGNYFQTVLSEGTVQPVALPDVTIDLNALFA